jgi:hypothetical protein
MQHVNIIIQHTDAQLQLIRGKPEQLGIEKTVPHMLFSYADVEVVVWVVGTLNDAERQQVTQSVLSYLESLAIG